MSDLLLEQILDMFVNEPHEAAHILCHRRHPEIADQVTGFATGAGFLSSCATCKSDLYPLADAIRLKFQGPLVADPPHSRACGFARHPHGSDCHSNCPSCGGKADAQRTPPRGDLMMYRKKPVVVEARRFESVQDGSHLATWCGGTNEASPERIDIPTLEGTMSASLGDWIIRGVAGEFYPCKPDIFDALYEAV